MVALVGDERFKTRECPDCEGRGIDSNCGCSGDGGECCHCEGSGILIQAPYGEFVEPLPDDVVDTFAAYWCAGNREHTLGEFIQMIAYYTVVQTREE